MTTTPDRRTYINSWRKENEKSLTGFRLLSDHGPFKAGDFVRLHKPTRTYYDPHNASVMSFIPRNLLQDMVKKNLNKKKYDALCVAAGFLV